MPYISRQALMIILLSLFLIGYTSGALAMPREYAKDKNTVALWHLNDSGNIFLDTVNRQKLKIFKTIQRADSLRKFKRSVKGFAKNRLLYGWLREAHPIHTFEAWIMWKNAADLPQYTSQIRQTVLVHPVNITFSTQLYFQADSLILEVRSGSRQDQLKVVSSKTFLRPNYWYHVAYTISKGNFDFDDDGEDTLVKLYLSGQGNTLMGPKPVADRLFEDFAYQDTARHFRIGQYSVQGNNFFRGRIDEVRYSNIARTQFTTFASVNNPSLFPIPAAPPRPKFRQLDSEDQHDLEMLRELLLPDIPPE